MRIVRRNELLAEQKSVRVDVRGRPLVEIRRFPVGGVKHVLKYVCEPDGAASQDNESKVRPCEYWVHLYGPQQNLSGAFLSACGL